MPIFSTTRMMTEESINMSLNRKLEEAHLGLYILELTGVVLNMYVADPTFPSSFLQGNLIWFCC